MSDKNMNNNSSSIPIGRMLRSDTAGFTFGCNLPEPDVPLFGDFVKAPAQQGKIDIIGVIYNIFIEDDLLVKQLITVPQLPETYIQDQRNNRQIPIEVSVLSIGYVYNDTITYSLPPQPPVTLDYINTCAKNDIVQFTKSTDYLTLILNSNEPSIDELIITTLRRAAEARSIEEQGLFLFECGKKLARLLSHDPYKLDSILRRLKVNYEQNI